MSRFAEDALQMAVAKYLDAKGVLWTHVGNERKSSIQAGVRLKKKGVKSGVPDCLIFEDNHTFCGLAIELKVEKDNGLKANGEPRKKTKGKLSENQKIWIDRLTKKNWSAHVAYNLDEAISIIEEYLSIK